MKQPAAQLRRQHEVNATAQAWRSLDPDISAVTTQFADHENHP